MLLPSNHSVQGGGEGAKLWHLFPRGQGTTMGSAAFYKFSRIPMHVSSWAVWYYTLKLKSSGSRHFHCCQGLQCCENKISEVLWQKPESDPWQAHNLFPYLEWAVQDVLGRLPLTLSWFNYWHYPSKAKLEPLTGVDNLDNIDRLNQSEIVDTNFEDYNES
jgi:hypothetical protein